MFKRSGNLLLAISLVFSMVSSLFMPGVIDAAPSNSNIIEQSSTSAGDLSSVAFGNGVFVAVGQGGISTSSNGVDWLISKKVGSPKLTSIVFANGLFIAIDGSEKAVYNSVDGENWSETALSITPERLKAVNGKFFVWQSVYKPGTNPPSYNVTLLESSSGVVWTDTRITSTNAIFGMQMLTDIAYGQNKYVVSANNAVYYTSTDLINWTTVTLTNLVIDHYNSSWPFVTNVMYLNNRFFSYIVTPFAKKVFTSTDGANWTVDASWDNKQFYGGASLNGSYLLYGQGVIYKSAAAPLDSTQWTTSDTHTSMMMNNMVFGNGKYVASGGSGLLVSSDLSAWSNVSGNLKSIAKDGNGNYVAVSSGEYGSIYKSNSSAVWNDVTSSKLPGMNAVTYGAGKFIAVTNKENYNLNAKVVTSTNGDTWTVTDSGVQDNLSGVAFGANQYVAVSDYGGIYSSVNGNAWTERFKNGDYAFNTVTYLNNQFVALGMNYNPSTYEPDSVVIAKSSDGVQWGTPLEIGFPNTSLKGIAYDGRSYILVGEDILSQQAVILTTPDLITYTKASISASALNNVSFGNGSFLAVGLSGKMFSSTDGNTWVQEASDLTSNLNGIVYDGNNFKVVGDYFTKMTLNLGPTLAYSITATAATLTPVVGADNTITLTVKNSLGDTDTTFTGTKEVTVAGYGAAPDGTYGSFGGTDLAAAPSKINVSFVEGVAQVNLKLNKAGAQAVVFSQAGVASPAATALNITSVAGGTATMKLTTGVSAPQTNGASFAQQPVITLLDQFGNVNTSDNSTVVSVSKKDAGSWTLTGNMTQTAVAGIVTFTDLGATNAAGITGAQLAFDATNLAQITSVAVNLPQPQGAQSITATAATLTPVVGADNTITLTVKNSLGDTDTTFTGTKEVTVAGYGAAPDGTYGSFGGTALAAAPSKINVSFVEGVAQVNLKLNKAGAQAVVFSQAGVASPAATALNITSVAGSTATMKLTTGVSAPQTNGGSFAQQPVITLLDQFGNVNTSDNSSVVSVSKKDAGSWTLTGNMKQTAVAGIVTFTDLGATNAAGITGAQLAFDATNLAQITSTVVDLTWPELAAPSIESVTAGNGYIRITWSPVYGTDSYAVYQSTASGVYGAEVATISSSENSYDAVGLTNGTAYYFIVKAINPDGISQASNEVTRTPQVPAPGAPILYPPVASNGIIGLTWDPVKGAIGYTIYQGITSGIYENKVATVSESVYNYDVTGLTNGESYYFIVKASNPGGESAASNEVSTKPRTSPSVPTNLIAVAGDGEATVTFTVPDSNGGTPITNYEVTASPGNIVTAGATSPITVTGLANGTTYSFTVKAINSAGSSEASAESNSVTPKSSTEVEVTPTPPIPTPTESPISTPTAPPSTTAPTITAKATPIPSSSMVEVLVNGKVEHAGTSTVSEQNGQTITTIVVDQAKIEQRMDKEGQNAIITIPVTATSDVIIGELNGQIIKDMEQKQAQLIIRTPKGTYTLSAAQIDISAISEQFGTDIALQDMKVQISISVPTSDVLRRLELLAAKEELTLVAQPLDFTVKVTYAGKTIEVTQFNTYVERMIPLADGVDLKKVTTGLVFEAGGTFRHVPTQIVVIDGKGYVKIHSLTNSTYFIVQDPQSFKDVTSHWAKDIVNEMASRKVINGIGNELFNPNQEITRAEFAAIIVRGLGLKLESGTTTFTDVKILDWYNDAVQTAYSYKLINGFEDGAFRPTDKITREQAMSMIAKAMIITDLKAKLPSKEASELLRTYTDAIEASGWAKSGIADTLQAGIITGRSGNVLAPKAFITRAEVAAIIQRLLQQSDLI